MRTQWPSLPAERIVADEHKDRDHWLECRRQYLTASDVPVLFDEGMIDRTTLAELKRGEREPDPPNIHMQLGHYLEPFLFERLQENHPELPVQRAGKLLVDAHQPRLAATPDVFVLLESGALAPIQLKYTGYGAKRMTDDMPWHFILQVQAELAVLEAPVGYLFCLHKYARGGVETGLYDIPRDDGLIEKIREGVATFWAEEIAR